MDNKIVVVVVVVVVTTAYTNARMHAFACILMQANA